jgi:hypothetical protein
MLRDLDALIVVSSPWVDGASAAGQTLEWLSKVFPPATTRKAIICVAVSKTQVQAVRRQPHRQTTPPKNVQTSSVFDAFTGLSHVLPNLSPRNGLRPRNDVRHIAVPSLTRSFETLNVVCFKTTWAGSWTPGVTAWPQPTRYAPRSRAFSPCHGSDPGGAHKQRRRREPAPATRGVAAAGCRAPRGHRRSAPPLTA